MSLKTVQFIKTGLITLIVTFFALFSSSPVFAGLSTSDAGKASCQGTLGGGKLSQKELQDTCDKYIQSLQKNSGNLAKNTVFEIIKDVAFVVVGIGLGVFVTHKQVFRKKKNNRK